MSFPRVYADFQNLDDNNRLRLDCAGTQEDLNNLGIKLKEMLELTFYTDDADDAGQSDELLIDGVVHYDRDSSCWVAEVDWTKISNASDADKRSTKVLA